MAKQKEQADKEAVYVSRHQAAVKVIQEMKPGEMTIEELAKLADEMFVAGGGKSDVDVAERWLWTTLETTNELGLTEVGYTVRRLD